MIATSCTTLRITSKVFLYCWRGGGQSRDTTATEVRGQAGGHLPSTVTCQIPKADYLIAGSKTLNF